MLFLHFGDLIVLFSVLFVVLFSVLFATKWKYVSIYHVNHKQYCTNSKVL